MNLANLSIKRPVFITCLVTVILVMGWLSLKRLPVDLFPNVTFPIVTVTTVYPGAGPEEVETLVSKIYEEELSNVPGLKKLSSNNLENVSVIIAEFDLKIDIKYAEQQVRDKIASARKKLPDDIEEPVIRKIDPADQPIVTLAVQSDLPDGELFQLVDKKIKPQIEQVNQVGLVEIVGGRKREIKVELDRNKLKQREISATQIASRLQISGQNIPAGKISSNTSDTVFRTLGEYKTINEIEKTIVNFVGNDIPITVQDVGRVTDSLEERKTYGYFNGKQAVLLNVYKQSGSNTIGVAEAIKKQVEKVNKTLGSDQKNAFKLSVVRDGSLPIKANVDDVYETIIIGIILTILVVYFFLGSARSTIITGLALPNSLLGAFILLAVAGFTVNIMTLLALSLAVGLLIDDAIVVRENIFRHIEMGASPIQAALEGTKEVTMAVVATTFTVIAVFLPIAFLQGVVGQFFKEFGLTICFALLISLFDALTMAPMLSAYFAGQHEDHSVKKVKKGFYDHTFGAMLARFNQFQDWLEDIYVKVLHFTLKRPGIVLIGALIIFFGSFAALKVVPKTFLPPQDAGEFSVGLDLKPGTSLEGMNKLGLEVDELVRKNKEVAYTVLNVGDKNGQPEKANIFVKLVPSKQRKGVNTSQFKEILRGQLKPYAYANPAVKDVDAVGGGQRPFNVNIIGENMEEIEKYSGMLLAKLKNHPALKDVDTSSRPGKPEFQVVPDRNKAEALGVSTTLMGSELRTMIEGSTPAVFREKGEEYDIRVRLQENQRNLKAAYQETFVPNINNSLIKLSAVANPVETQGPSTINRQDRGRYIQISADVAPDGPGMGGAMADIERILKDEIKIPPTVRYQFVGQAENFAELASSIVIAGFLGTMFIYFVLASLYESFVTPFTIMLVLPLAMCGAFYALAMAGSSLDLFSMIGCVMLLGVATKNSILLVDYANQQVHEKGMKLNEAMIAAGKSRLRPILMTSFALIAGMVPLAIGLNEASKQRTSMGIAVIGGLISSTLLTLVVIPAAYSYIERFRVWSGGILKRLFVTESEEVSVK